MLFLACGAAPLPVPGGTFFVRTVWQGKANFEV
nr:MAG TPA: hypothetical protein [Bacteriophage sp.]